MVDSSFENVVIDHYYAFRIFEPYKLNSERQFFRLKK